MNRIIFLACLFFNINLAYSQSSNEKQRLDCRHQGKVIVTENERPICFDWNLDCECDNISERDLASIIVELDNCLGCGDPDILRSKIEDQLGINDQLLIEILIKDLTEDRIYTAPEPMDPTRVPTFE